MNPQDKADLRELPTPLICIQCKKEIHTEVDNFHCINESKSEYAHAECHLKKPVEYSQGAG
jgi:hypothetical protein